MGRWTQLLLVAAACGVATCGSSAQDKTPPAPLDPLGEVRELRATYTFPTPQQVRTTIGLAGIVDPAHSDLVAAPSGSRRVELMFRWRDHGADPLSWDALRFTALTQMGSRIHELYRVPAAPKQFGADGPAHESRVGFAVPDHDGLIRVDLASIINGSPLTARWELPQR